MDGMSFTFELLTFERRKVTKRTVLKKVAWIFDVLIFVSKIFLQELWRMKLGWDTIIDDNAKREWKKWQTELKNVCKVEIA